MLLFASPAGALSVKPLGFEESHPICRHNRLPALPSHRPSRYRIAACESAPVAADSVEKPATLPKTSDASESTTAPTSTVCEACGIEGGPTGGCDGTGRIPGGVGAVLTWWPIKAYRPCPELIKAKKKYRRSGQSLDEIAFGRESAGDDKSLSERLRGD